MTLVIRSVNKYKYFLHQRKGPVPHKDTEDHPFMEAEFSKDPELGALSIAAQQSHSRGLKL